MRTRSVSFCSGSLMLEGRLAEPESTVSGGVVLCHPHTMYAGSMSSALLPPLQRALSHAGFLTLRFNFRGAGRSEGTYDEGRGEVDDALAAIAFVVADLPAAAPIVVAGWSFGSVVGLHAAVRHPRVVAAVAIAPPMSGGTHGLSPEPRRRRPCARGAGPCS